ncbi:hypothetical protein D3C73_687490 [compost metagenome]
MGGRRACFGHETVFHQPSVIGALFHRLHLGHGRIKQLHRLDVAAFPAPVGQQCHGHAGLHLGVLDHRFRLGKENQRRLRFLRKGEVTVGGTTGNLQIYQAFRQIVAANDLAVNFQQFLGRDRQLDTEFGDRALQAGGMTIIFQKLAADDAGHLIDRIGKQKAAIENGNLGIGFRQPFAIEIDDTGQDGTPSG